MSYPHGAPPPGYGYQQPPPPGYGYQPPPPGYPPPGYPPPGYGPPGYPPRPASGGTAITAALLAMGNALLGGLGVLMSLSALDAIDAPSGDYDMLYVSGGACGLLFLGAVLMLARVQFGQVIVIFMALAGGIMGVIAAGTVSDVTGSVPPLTLVGIGMSALIFILAIVPSTGRWIGAKKQRPMGYGPPPGYPMY